MKTDRAAKRKTDSKARVQFHLGETLIQRLGVHCAMTGRSQSAMVEEILASWLTRFGKGRELWGVGVDHPAQEEVSVPQT